MADITYNREKSPLARHMNTHSSHKINYMVIQQMRTTQDIERSNELRKKSEMYWIHQLRTFYPRGMNKKDELK